MKILVFGASGMLGSAVVRILSEKDNWQVFGSVRSNEIKKCFNSSIAKHLIAGCDVLNLDNLQKVFNQVRPDVVINCISLSKQLINESDPLLMIPIYSLLPHQLAKFCKDIDARLIHISTDGVFSGEKGNYVEDDPSDAKDFYGAAKFIGEVHDQHAVTIRTSIIGHELKSSNGLLSWFLSENKECRCFSKAIFSGFPTVVLAQVIRDVVIPNTGLHGVYHIASDPISKCDLLHLIASVYGKSIEIIPDDSVKIDRSLNAERFRLATGYTTPTWAQLVETMHSYQ